VGGAHVCALAAATALIAPPPGRPPPEHVPVWIELPPQVEPVPAVAQRPPALAALASRAAPPHAGAAQRAAPAPGMAPLAAESGVSNTVARPLSAPPPPEPPAAQAPARPASPPGPAAHSAPVQAGGSPPAPASPADAALPAAVAASDPAPAPAASGGPALASRAGTSGSGATEPARGSDGQPLPDSALGYLRRPDPVYPPASRRLGEAGLVRLHVLIDVEGRPQQVTVVDTSGFPRLDEAASRAVRRALFRPYRRDGEARPAWISLSVRFSLEDA
jgi:protein TonB